MYKCDNCGRDILLIQDTVTIVKNNQNTIICFDCFISVIEPNIILDESKDECDSNILPEGEVIEITPEKTIKRSKKSVK